MMRDPLSPMLFKTPVLPYDFHNWVMNHVWLHKQPMSLWLMAASIKLFGSTEFSVRLPSLILSLVAIYLTFRIATFFSDERTGLLAAFFHAINGFVIEIATGREATDHVDNTFFFFIELAVFLILVFLKKKRQQHLIVIGIALGCALLSKYLPALIVLPIFVVLTIDQHGWKKTTRHTLIVGFVAAAVALPWQLYIFKTFPNEANWESQYNFLHLTQAVEGHNGTFGTHFYWAMRLWNELIYLIFGWFIVHVFKNRSDKKLLALAVWVVLPYIFFSMVATKMMAYPLFVAPAVFTMMAMFCWFLKDNPLKMKGLSQLILTAVLVLTIRYSYERVKPFDFQLAETQTADRLRGWKTQLPTDGKAVVFNTPYYIETMFYHDITAAYPHLPTEAQITELLLRGYKIFVVRNENVPTEFLNRTDIQLL